MIIQFTTDHNIHGSDGLQAYFTTSITQALKRFGTHISRLEVHLADENGKKQGGDDQRCTIDAKLDGLQNVAVTCHADTLEQAVRGATDKLKAALDHSLGKLKDR
jgi:ribosomal subunit interface protein